MDVSSTATFLPTAPTLVIDGSSSVFFTGILGSGGQWLAKTEHSDAPLESLFPSVQSVLSSAALSLESLCGYVYCEGPGSVLGIRLCAMALETWSRLHPASASFFTYNSLRFTAACVLADHPDIEEALLVSDWKKDAWNAISIRRGQPMTTDVALDKDLADWSGALFHLPQRKGWQKPPAGAIEVDYQPVRLPELLSYPGLLESTQEIRLYATGTNTFQKWTPERHRASS